MSYPSKCDHVKQFEGPFCFLLCLPPFNLFFFCPPFSPDSLSPLALPSPSYRLSYLSITPVLFSILCPRQSSPFNQILTCSPLLPFSSCQIFTSPVCCKISKLVAKQELRTLLSICQHRDQSYLILHFEGVNKEKSLTINHCRCLTK